MNKRQNQEKRYQGFFFVILKITSLERLLRRTFLGWVDGTKKIKENHIVGRTKEKHVSEK